MGKHMTDRRTAAHDLAAIALSVSLLAICSYISVPAFVGHITLQLFAVFLIASTLDLKKSFTAVSLYVAMGLIGVPIFASFRGGISVLFDASGGYLLGFLIISVTVPLARRIFGDSTLCALISSILSLLCTYAIASLWFMVVTSAPCSLESFRAALVWCALPYLIFDPIKLALALLCAPRVRKFLDFSDN